MEVRAVGKYIRVQPRKVRIVADEIRGKSAIHSLHLLRYHPAKSARVLRKVLLSAVYNAANNHGLAPEALKIEAIKVDEGPRMKRIQARAMGRAFRIIKKTSHITVVVAPEEPTEKVKAHGTKAKARPTFAAPKKRGGKKAAAPAAEAAAEPMEATPVTASEAPEEAGSAQPIEEAETTNKAETGEPAEEKGEE
jgi:large subunit ribosomal protein L22